LSNKTKIFLIIVAGLILVAIGVFASVLLVQRFQAAQTPVAVEEETVKTTVAVVTHDLSLGTRIENGDVELVDVPIEVAPRDAISDVESAIGKIVKTDLVQGEMLLQHNLADPTNNNGDLSFILADDHVLLAFPADDLMSKQSMVQRGDIIDIFATFIEEVKTVGETTTDQEEEPKTRTFTVDIMQKISVTALVLDVVQEEESNTNTEENLIQSNNQQSPKNVTIKAYLLALAPQDALVLKHFKDTGAIFDFVLRAPTSTLQFDLTPVTDEYIIEFYGLEILP
jgi:pilus assembly protein CpaB